LAAGSIAEVAENAEVFERGIHEIEAMGFMLPLYSKNGWSPFIR
jgi:hypothetical protein